MWLQVSAPDTQMHSVDSYKPFVIIMPQQSSLVTRCCFALSHSYIVDLKEKHKLFYHNILNACAE